MHLQSAFCRRASWMASLLCWMCLQSLNTLSPFSICHAVAEEKSSQKVAGSTQEGDDYVIGPGDVLELMVWKEPDLSRTVTVRLDGKISFPLVDDIQAARLTLPMLKKRLTDVLSGYIESPSIYVMLEASQSKKIYILGKVNRPGEYVLNKPTTVLQAMATAGGFGEWAGKDSIVILRLTPSGQSRITFDYDRVVSGKDIEQNIFLQPDDVIVVP